MTIKNCFAVFALVALATANTSRTAAYDRSLNRSQNAPAKSLIAALVATQGVTGFEQDMRASILKALPDSLRGHATTDSAGNLILIIGHGEPKTIIGAPMDEVGYAVSEITSDGYIRLNRVGRGMPSKLWDQFHIGQPVVIRTREGLIPGVTACLSVHLQPGRNNPGADAITSLDDLWVDVGAPTAEQVEKLGVRLLDPVSLRDRVIELAGNHIAGVAAGNRAACAALIELAEALADDPPDSGPVALVWMAQEWFGRKGSDRLSQEFHADRVVIIDSSTPAFPMPGSIREEGISGEMGKGPILRSGASILLPAARKAGVVYQMGGPDGGDIAEGKSVPSWLKASYTGGPDWASSRVATVELPTAFNGSPVETVYEGDAQQLVALLEAAVGSRLTPAPSMRSTTPANLPVLTGTTDARVYPASTILRQMVETASVSGDEGRMRTAVEGLLPSWAKPEVDDAGNVIVSVGSGEPYKVFLAHMDEVGYVVEEIEPNGTLKLQPKGFGYPRLYEAHQAFVHAASADIPAVELPPDGYMNPESKSKAQAPKSPGAPEAGNGGFGYMAYVGTNTRAETEQLGIKTGDTVTVPKRFQLLAYGRATARSLDDRNGCTALLDAIRKLDPQKVRGRVTFVWTTREELGLEGAKYFSEHMTERPRYVFGVDTFVSSDSPLETHRFAYAPLGRGAVIRALDNSNVAPPAEVDRLLALAAQRHLALQFGVTGGGNDGAVFTRFGADNIPLAWPLRYSHSPAEVIDLRDLESLAGLVEEIVYSF